MPVYTYRREDGTTFDYRQKFTDEPLASDPSTGQRVVRVVQNAGVIFKGSGFYVNDSKGASKKNLSSSGGKESSEATAPAESAAPAASTPTAAAAD